MIRQRYSLLLTLDLPKTEVRIRACRRTKEALRTAWSQAKLMVAKGVLTSAEAWDDKEHELLARAPKAPPDPIQQTTNQPTKNKRETKRSTKNVVQPNNTGRKPGKRSRA